MTQAEQIQGVLRERVTDLDNHILTKEGVYAEINLRKADLTRLKAVTAESILTLGMSTRKPLPCK